YGIILLTAQKYHAEINLQARLASIFFCKKLVVASGGARGQMPPRPTEKKVEIKLSFCEVLSGKPEIC
ncbi:MAG: hypothetical protein MI923_22885, partial [Phycisphaerales bacterium]|nr:hypothetical protein [Phycisphaerales bacterium]